jgi:hypothetical protein
MSQTRLSAAVLALAVGSARASSILYVTDMPAYEALVKPTPTSPPVPLTRTDRATRQGTMRPVGPQIQRPVANLRRMSRSRIGTPVMCLHQEQQFQIHLVPDFLLD